MDPYQATPDIPAQFAPDPPQGPPMDLMEMVTTAFQEAKFVGKQAYDEAVVIEKEIQRVLGLENDTANHLCKVLMEGADQPLIKPTKFMRLDREGEDITISFCDFNNDDKRPCPLYV